MKKRKNIRLHNYNYSKPGSYFITICTERNKDFFTVIKHKKIVEKIWTEIPDHINYVKLDEFIVMPNHVHGIISILNGVGTSTHKGYWKHALSLQTKRRCETLATVVGSFKSAVSREMHKDLKDFKWQRSYYEHVIRNEKELLNIRKYINNNPLKWNLDIENSNNQKKKVDLDKYYRKIYQGEF